MSRAAGRTERIVAWVEPELKQQIEECAEKDNRSVSDWLRVAAKRLVTDPDSMALSEHARLISRGP